MWQYPWYYYNLCNCPTVPHLQNTPEKHRRGVKWEWSEREVGHQLVPTSGGLSRTMPGAQTCKKTTLVLKDWGQTGCCSDSRWPLEVQPGQARASFLHTLLNFTYFLKSLTYCSFNGKSALQYLLSFTHIHTPMATELPCQAPACPQGSVVWSMTLKHMDWRSPLKSVLHFFITNS